MDCGLQGWQIVNEITAPIHAQWYTDLIDECRGLLVETEFSAKWLVIEGYHAVGKCILDATPSFERAQIYGQGIVRHVAQSLGRDPRRVWEMLSFAQAYPDLAFLPGGKEISWRKITRELLTDHHDDALTRVRARLDYARGYARETVKLAADLTTEERRQIAPAAAALAEIWGAL
jgi:hypothetical protein